MTISMIFKRLGITLFFMACGLFNAWLPDGQIGSREWATACLWGIAANLTLLPAHWTAKQQFALALPS